MSPQPAGDNKRKRQPPPPVSSPPFDLKAEWIRNWLEERCNLVVESQNKPDPASGTPPANSSDPTLSLDAYLAQMSKYATGVKAITDAKSFDEVDKAMDDAKGALDSLVKVADKDADTSAVTAIFAGLAKAALREAQTEALKKSTAGFNAAWSKVAPKVKAAARLRYAQRLSYLSQANYIKADLAQANLNNTANYGSPAERFFLFNNLNGPVVAAAAAAAAKAAQKDPGPSLDAFNKANADFAAALADPSRQTEAVLKEIEALQKLVAGLSKSDEKSGN